MEISTKVKSLIDTIWQKDGEVVFISYAMLPKTESTICYLLNKVFPQNQNDYATPIFSCIKELATNSTKANIKNILLKEKNIANPFDKNEVLTKLKSILKDDILLEYGLKSKQYGLSTRIYMRKEENTLIIRIINPLPLSYEQMERISRKISVSKKYDCLANFYIENPDPEAEGMGLGLPMVVLLLKGLNINPDVFRIYSDMKKKTIAELAIPIR